MAVDVEERNSKWTNLATLLGLVILGVLLWHRQKPLIVLAITLGVLIFVHELGHFLAARAVGVRVDEFALGFGPKLVTLAHRGNTTYTIRVLPLGGFVSMAGMQPDEADLEDGLAGKSPAARALVFAAGPLMNFVLALVILCLGSAVVGTVQGKGVVVTKVTAGSVAQQMGLQVSDQVLSVRGVPVQNVEQMIHIVENGGATDTEMVVLRQGHEVTLHGTPKREVDAATGHATYRFGFAPMPKAYESGPRLSLAESTRRGVMEFGDIFRQLGTIVAQHKLKENLGGPLMMYQMTKQSTKLPPLFHLDQMSQLSISLAVLNLLPIPVLDGGHLLLLGIEVVQRRRLTPGTVRAAHLLGFVVIAAIFVLIMVNDVRRLLG